MQAAFTVPAADNASTLEYDPKWIARVAYDPLPLSSNGQQQPGPHATNDRNHPQEQHCALSMTIARFDVKSAVLSGVVHWVNDDLHSVSYAPLDIIPKEEGCLDGKVIRSDRVWWGYNSSGRFGMVVPIKDVMLKDHLQLSGSPGEGGHVMLPRALTLEPPSLPHGFLGEDTVKLTPRSNRSRTPRSRNGSMSATPQQQQLLSESFIGKGSFVRAMRLGEGGSAAAALLQDIADEDDLGATRAGGVGFSVAPDTGMTGGDYVARNSSRDCVTCVAETLEDVIGELRSVPLSSGVCSYGEQLDTDWILSRKPSMVNVSHLSTAMLTLAQQGQSASGGGGGSSKKDPQGGGGAIEFGFSNIGQMLPHFFSQKPSMTACAYAMALGKYSSKLGFDQSQYVAFVGDARGWFLVTPSRDPLQYCEGGVQPIAVEGSVAALPRGAFEISMHGHVYPTASDSWTAFVQNLPMRLRMPTPIHKLRSITTITVHCSPKSHPEFETLNPVTKIREQLLSEEDVDLMNMKDVHMELWEDAVETMRVIPTHVHWCEGTDLVAPTTVHHGGKRGKSKSVVTL